MEALAIIVAALFVGACAVAAFLCHQDARRLEKLVTDAQIAFGDQVAENADLLEKINRRIRHLGSVEYAERKKREALAKATKAAATAVAASDAAARGAALAEARAAEHEDFQRTQRDGTDFVPFDPLVGWPR